MFTQTEIPTLNKYYILLCTLLSTFFFLLFGFNITAHAENPVVEIELPKKEVDIVFTVGKTAYAKGDLTLLSDRLKASLAAKGIKANITSVETNFIKTDSSDASIVYNNWSSVSIPFDFRGSITPSNKSTDWSLNGGYVLPKRGSRPAMGLINDASKSYNTQNATIKFNWGIQSSGFYDFTHGESGFIFGMTDPQNYYVYIMDNHSACGNILYDGAEALVKVTNGVATTINTSYLPMYANGQKYSIEIKIEGNNIKIYRDSVLKFNFNDYSKSQIEGTYGFYVWDQLGAYFNNIAVDTESTKLFDDALTNHTWKNKNEKMVLNISDDFITDNKLTDPITKGRILTFISSGGLNVSSVGLPHTTTKFNNFINGNGLYGKGFSATNRYELERAVDEYANYVAIYLADKAGDSGTGIIAGQPVKYKISNLYPAGSKPWKLSQNANYYENGNGRAPFHNEYLAQLPDVYDKVGQYQLTYNDGVVTPVYLYVHRKPIALLNANVRNYSSYYTVDLTSSSYDLDKVSSANNGIALEEWRYKQVTADDSGSFIYGKLSGALPPYSTYIVQLRVKDTNDAYSDWETKVITSGNIATPPIARFNLPKTTVWEGEDVILNNLSFSPNGTPLVAHKWTILDSNGTVRSVFYNSSPQFYYNFKANGLGLARGELSKNYTIKLEVTDSNNLVSNSYSQEVTLEADTTPPVINVSPTSVDWTNSDITVDYSFEDLNGSGVKEYSYAVTNSTTQPTNWTTIQRIAYGSVNITNTDMHYLHLKVTDNSNNTTYKYYGLYKLDKLSPNKPSINLNTTEWSAKPITFTISNIADAHSGVKTVEYRYNKGNWITYTPNSTVTIPSNIRGIINIESRVTDKVGNVSEFGTAIAKVDDIPPVIDNVEIIKVDSETQGFKVTAHDNESGLHTDGAYTYMQKIQGVDEDFKTVAENVKENIYNIPTTPSSTLYFVKTKVRDLSDNISLESKTLPVVSAPVVKESVVGGKDEYDNTVTIHFDNPIGDEVEIEVYRSGYLVGKLSKGNKFKDANLNYERTYHYEFIAVSTVDGERVESLVEPLTVTIGTPTIEARPNSDIFYMTPFTEEFNIHGTVAFMQGGHINFKLVDAKDKELQTKDIEVPPYLTTQWTIGDILHEDEGTFKIMVDKKGSEHLGKYKKVFDVKVKTKEPYIGNALENPITKAIYKTE